MKAFVITNETGTVVGHVRVVETDAKDTPRAGRPTVSAGHHVHEVELPHELLQIKTAPELHRALEKHLTKHR